MHVELPYLRLVLFQSSQKPDPTYGAIDYFKKFIEAVVQLPSAGAEFANQFAQIFNVYPENRAVLSTNKQQISHQPHGSTAESTALAASTEEPTLFAPAAKPTLADCKIIEDNASNDET